MRRSATRFAMIIFLLAPAAGHCSEVSDVLILHDLGPFSVDTPEVIVPGDPPVGGPETSVGSGPLSEADHFPDNQDVTYTVIYRRKNAPPSSVTVTSHAGIDSSRWLQHEIEKSLRAQDDDEKRGQLYSDAGLMSIGDGTVFRILGIFIWMSNRNVIQVEGDYLQTGPLDVVRAYVEKYPPTIPKSLVLDRAHDEEWIRSEMERRLWLVRKWIAGVQTGAVQPRKGLPEAAKSMIVFLDYREKYFGPPAAGDKRRVYVFCEQNDDNGIYATLKECEQWWEANREKSMKQ